MSPVGRPGAEAPIDRIADPYATELAVATEIAEAAGRLIVERADRIERIDAKGRRDV